MNIMITPEDIIKRCLWTDYRRFCLKDKTTIEINYIIENNSPVILSEEDAYVIGLLKIIETPNLMHRFKEHIGEVLKIKSSIYNNKLYIVKSIIIKEISSFKDRFPEKFKAPFEYKTGIDDLIVLSNKILDEVEKLQIYSFQNQNKIYTYVSSNQVKNLIDDKKIK